MVERLDETLNDAVDARMPRLYTQRLPLSLDEMRCILFQLFSALEVAWLTHRFVHGDLHADNVMLKRCGDVSPLYQKNFLYRRYNDPDVWYVLERHLLDNRIVKLIDFGRARINAPLSPQDRPLGGERHVHPRRIGPLDEGDETYGAARGVHARFDVRVFFARFFLSRDFDALWAHWARVDPEGSAALNELIDAAIDCRRLLAGVGRGPHPTSTDDLVTQAREDSWIQMMDPRAINKWAADAGEWGLTASEVLNARFFAPLRRPVARASLSTVLSSRWAPPSRR